MNVDLRQNVRVNLHALVILQGTDRFGKPFHVEGESIDFSRKGLGLLVSEDLVGPGSVVVLRRNSSVTPWCSGRGTTLKQARFESAAQ